VSAIATIDRAGAWRWITKDDSRIADSSHPQVSADGKQVPFAAPAYECGEPVHGPGRGPDRLDLVAIE
jgi:hypothetical protein